MWNSTYTSFDVGLGLAKMSTQHDSCDYYNSVEYKWMETDPNFWYAGTGHFEIHTKLYLIKQVN